MRLHSGWRGLGLFVLGLLLGMPVMLIEGTDPIVRGVIGIPALLIMAVGKNMMADYGRGRRD